MMSIKASKRCPRKFTTVDGKWVQSKKHLTIPDMECQRQEETKSMNARDYLNRAHKLDKRIDSKLEQVASLRELATKATAVLSHEPKGDNKNIHAMENNVVKIMDLENEIAADIDALLDLKHEIGDVIDLVPNTDCRLLLEYRYISLKTWEDICILLNYSWRTVGRLHSKALKMVQEVIQ